MSEFQPFVMERMMSRHEQEVEFNLSESGVHPVRLEELVAARPDCLKQLLSTELNYPHMNGIPSLRENIAAMYQGATAANVLVTVGAIEANYISTRTILSAGDEIVVMLPNYMQVWGIARNHAYSLKTFRLREDWDWAPDLDQLRDVVSSNTRLIAICNPDNPTGYVFTADEMEEIIAVADRCGAWILADEVYAGAERLQQPQAPSFFGGYERVMATGSVSKAYGLPGLRLGWVVAPVPLVDEIWARHEYTTLSASMLSNQLAAIALSREVRPLLIERTRQYIRKGYAILEEWMDSQDGVFSVVPPQAAAIAFVRYQAEINSAEFVERLIRDKRVLIVPGDHFGLDRFLRISFGLPRDYLLSGLGRIREMMEEVQ